MANLLVKDGAAATKYLKATGTGSDGDPYIPQHAVTDGSGSLTIDSAQLPAALAANGGIKVEGVAGGVAVPVSIATAPALVAGMAIIGATKDAGANWTAVHLVVNSSNATSGVDICAAPTSLQKRVLTDLVVSVGTAMAVSILEETSGTVMHGPYYMDANAVIQITPRSTPMSKLATADKKYRVVTSAAGNITVETWTYSEA